MEKQLFNEYILIVSGRMFNDYIDKLKTNKNLYSIPLTIIFTLRKKNFRENIDKKYSKYLDHKYYNILGIVDSKKDLIDKIKNYPNEVKNRISTIQLGKIAKPPNYDDCLVFQYVDDRHQLMFPYLYHNIMSQIKVDYNSIKNFNFYLLENYGKYERIKELLEILYFCEDVPHDIVAKYWGKIYTLETSFYYNINWALMQLKNQDYNTYIQVFYSGFKDLSYKDDKPLYRGAKISTEEFNKLKKYYESNKEQGNNNDINNKFKPTALIYSRAFLSFSLKIEKAEEFMNRNSNTGNSNNSNLTKVLFILENLSQNKMSSNVTFNKKINPKEQEILFFPFSSFVVNKIEEKKDNEDYYKIHLNYLGIYKHIIEETIEEIKDKPEIIEELSENNTYATDVFKSQTMIFSEEVKDGEIQVEIPEEINCDTLNNKREENITKLNEKKISNIFITVNKTIIKEEQKEKEEIKEIVEIETPIQNDLIKLCFCKKEKPYIPNLKNVFNMNIFEYNSLDEIIQKINDNKDINGKECLLILNERAFQEYINKIKNLKSFNIPLSIIYSSNQNKAKEKFKDSINNKKNKILGITESYKDLKDIINETIKNPPNVEEEEEEKEEKKEEEKKEEKEEEEEEEEENEKDFEEYEKDEKMFKNKLKIILINLEAKHSDIEEVKKTIEIFLSETFEKFSNNQISIDDLKKIAVDKIYNIFDEELKLEKEKDKKFLENILKYIYDKQNNNLNDFIEYIKAILENYIDFNNMSEEEKNNRVNYIINYMNKEDQLLINKKEMLKEIYTKNSTITLEDFNDIVLGENENKVFMDNKAIEFILYRMKREAINKNINSLNSLDVSVFLDFYDKLEFL